MAIPSRPASASNFILSALSSEESRRLLAQGEQLDLEVGSVLYEAKQPVQNVYFMLSGMASIVAPMEDGSSIEVLIAGREGQVVEVERTVDRSRSDLFVGPPEQIALPSDRLAKLGEGPITFALRVDGRLQDIRRIRVGA